MPFRLSSHNVLQYLIEQNIDSLDEVLLNYYTTDSSFNIQAISCKNFNLIVDFGNDFQLLVKQEPYDTNGETDGEFWHAWFMQTLIKNFRELQVFESLITKAIHFDPEHSILIFDYLSDHVDLDDFYKKQQIFEPAIATTLGQTLASLHAATFAQTRYHQFLLQQDKEIDQIPHFLRGFEQLKPDILGMICLEGMEFFRLFQRYNSLRTAIAQLENLWEPCCLIHADLKLSNVLLNLDWQRQSFQETSLELPKIRLIDWEKLRWGDPAYDLANIMTDYLKLWLNSLIISPAIDLETSLKNALVPLETLQPSLIALIQSYLMHFPAILQRFPRFVDGVIQYTGYMLLERLRIRLEYHGTFGNREICMMQIAKTLLCQPEVAIPMILGTAPLTPNSPRLTSEKPDSLPSVEYVA